MARTYLSGNNSRGGRVTGMNATYSHLRGWDSGVYVHFEPDGDADRFAVRMTGGSNGSHEETPLGFVTSTPDGPQWTPQGHSDAARWARQSRERLNWLISEIATESGQVIPEGLDLTAQLEILLAEQQRLLEDLAVG